MIIKRLGIIGGNQQGSAFTELLIAITIAALIAIAVTMGVFQIVTGHFRTSNHLTAVRQVQEAGYWVSHDTQMAWDVATENLTGENKLELSWVAWDNSQYNVTYSIQGDNLQRRLVIHNEDGDPISDTTSIIARFIDSSQTSCELAAGELIFTVTATVGSGSQQGIETRVYNVLPRPD